MVYSFNDIRCKEIINVRNGCRIGFPDDIEFENCTAKIAGSSFTEKRGSSGFSAEKRTSA